MGQLSLIHIYKIVTNRWLGLPIFAVVMFLVYYIAMVGVGAAATDWANDGLFGDGWHLFGIGSADYNEDADAYNEASLIVDGYDAYVEENGTAPTGDFPYEVEDEETLEILSLIHICLPSFFSTVTPGQLPSPVPTSSWATGPASPWRRRKAS